MVFTGYWIVRYWTFACPPRHTNEADGDVLFSVAFPHAAPLGLLPRIPSPLMPCGLLTHTLLLFQGLLSDRRSCRHHRCVAHFSSQNAGLTPIILLSTRAICPWKAFRFNGRALLKPSPTFDFMRIFPPAPQNLACAELCRRFRHAHCL